MPVDGNYQDSTPIGNANPLGLTRGQRDLLRFITREYERHGVPPSFEEMKDHLGLRSKSGVHRMVHALRERGHITMAANKARSIAPAASQRPLSESLRDVLHRCELTSYAERELVALLGGEAAE